MQPSNHQKIATQFRGLHAMSAVSGSSAYAARKVEQVKPAVTPPRTTQQTSGRKARR
ncbi:MAG: hypothetical protein ACT4NU_01080 [Chromatiales bacterium]